MPCASHFVPSLLIGSSAVCVLRCVCQVALRFLRAVHRHRLPPISWVRFLMAGAWRACLTVWAWGVASVYAEADWVVAWIGRSLREIALAIFACLPSTLRLPLRLAASPSPPTFFPRRFPSSLSVCSSFPFLAVMCSLLRLAAIGCRCCCCCFGQCLRFSMISCHLRRLGIWSRGILLLVALLPPYCGLCWPWLLFLVLQVSVRCVAAVARWAVLFLVVVWHVPLFCYFVLFYRTLVCIKLDRLFNHTAIADKAA